HRAALIAARVSWLASFEILPFVLSHQRVARILLGDSVDNRLLAFAQSAIVITVVAVAVDITLVAFHRLRSAMFLVLFLFPLVDGLVEIGQQFRHRWLYRFRLGLTIAREASEYLLGLHRRKARLVALLLRIIIKLSEYVLLVGELFAPITRLGIG